MQKKARVYPIGVVTKLTGQTQRQIRYYEAVGLVSPSRTKGKQRLYSPEDIDRLLLIRALLDKGLTLQGIKNILQTQQIPAGWEKSLTIPRLDYDPIFAGLQDGHEAKEQTEHSVAVDQLFRGRIGKEESGGPEFPPVGEGVDQ